MRAPGLVNSRLLMLAALAVLLVAAHTAPLYYLLSHRMVSAGVAAGLLVLMIAVHLLRARRR